LILWCGMFNFKMQTILDVRKTVEDKVISEFSEQQKQLQKEKDNLQVIQQQKDELIDSLRNMQDKKVNVSDITVRSSSIKRYQKDEALQKEKIQDVIKKVDQKRDELMEATKKKKVMEICKTKQHDQYQSDARMLERKAVDEMVILRHNRRKQE
jgi:flagellar protein FliJ